jgi:hypothetical protein
MQRAVAIVSRNLTREMEKPSHASAIRALRTLRRRVRMDEPQSSENTKRVRRFL